MSEHPKKQKDLVPETPNEPRSGAIRSEGRLGSFEWVESLIIAIIIVGVVFTFVFRIITVNGDSMYPNLQHNDRLVVSSWFYTPKKGDVVILKRTEGLNEAIVKRVIATAGDRVYLDYGAGEVYVNGERLDETVYLDEDVRTYQPDTRYDLLDMPPEGLEVPDGHIFVLGDNRKVSLDSRYTDVGMVDTRYVLGKAQFTIFPFSRFGGVINEPAQPAGR